MSIYHHKYKRGNILLGSITIVLAVSVTGAALMQVSLRKNVSSGYQQRQQNVFHMAESCVASARTYLRNRTKAPDNSLLPLAFSGAMSDFHRDDNTELHKEKLSGYDMACTLSGSPDSGDAVVQSSVANYAQGEMVQTDSGYGLSGDLSPGVYYWMDASGNGPEHASKRVRAVISARY